MNSIRRNNMKMVMGAFTTIIFGITLPADATTLKGRVSVDKEPGTNISAALTASARQNSLQAKAVEGGWNCTSKVTASSCASVTPGTIVQSFIQYLRNAQGALVQNWQENGWTPAASKIWKLGEWTFSTNKESCYTTAQGSITARSQEKIRVVSPGEMIAESTVQQYLNGRYIGTYKTSSILHKISG